jgi:Mrp family chromosome partitioning ATPase
VSEIKALAGKAAPGLSQLLEITRHFASRYLSRELPHESVIGIMGARSGEGRTTVSLSLAAALAEIYNRVVIVELASGIRGTDLLTEVGLSGETEQPRQTIYDDSLESMLHETHKENLWLLPARASNGWGSRLDSSSHTMSMLAELRESFDVVVVDLPPLLTSEEAPVLLRGITGIVLVVSAGSSTIDDVAQVLRLCPAIPIKGVLLNKVRLRAPRWLASLFRS